MVYNFGPFQLDLTEGSLWRTAQRVALRPKTFELLVYLVTHAGQLVSKEALLEAVWPATAVGDAVLKTSLGELRKALGETAKAPQWIITVHRRGYRFEAPVTEHTEPVRAPVEPVPQAVPPAPLPEPPAVAPTPVALPSPTAERRHLTVLFCDLVDSTRWAESLDPEDYRALVQVYHQTCARLIAQYEGYLAQYLGDGVLAYFGYPLAHEDDAQRAGRAGLGILHALAQHPLPQVLPTGERLAVRLGLHTGLVVVDEVGPGSQQAPLALGATPNLAARLQALAAPNTLVLSAVTLPLLGGFFTCQSLGTPALKGRTQPLEVYQVLGETTARSRLDVASRTGLTPLVGREPEMALLQERWAQVQDGVGQVVLLSGEAGIGKSRLVRVLQEQVVADPQAWLTPCQCSPYHQHSALYPLIDLLDRVVLRFDREVSLEHKLRRLEGHVGQYGLPLADTVPLFAALLSLPLPASYAPLTLTPAQQKQRTLHALLTILLRIAAQRPVLLVVEDLHWADPSTLEFLSLIVDQGPTARILALFTHRPDFSPPWPGRAHLTQVILQRLSRSLVAAMLARLTPGKTLPAEVVEQIVAKTDGVPLFVEEVTKMVLESGLLQEREEGYALTGSLPPLAIPTTLHDALLARLDRLGMAKGLAQLGAMLGREFAYELLQAVALWDEAMLQGGLQQLVTAEVLYPQGLPPQATYVFKHALIQDVAYQSLLKRTRQQYHWQIAEVLEARFPETVETQPEVLAHHYTEADLHEPAVRYWQRAGERAMHRSAQIEAISHLNHGLEVLTAMPETPERLRHELDLQVSLGAAWARTRGWSAPEVEQTYARARALCDRLGEPSQLLVVLLGQFFWCMQRAEWQAVRELGEYLLALTRRQASPVFLLSAHTMLGVSRFFLGEVAAAQAHFTQGSALYVPAYHRTLVAHHAYDLGVHARCYVALSLWLLGAPAQALAQMQEARTLTQELAHPYSLGFAFQHVTRLHQWRRDVSATLTWTEAMMALCAEHGFGQYATQGGLLHGWALSAQGQTEADLEQMHQCLIAYEATGAAIWQPYFLALLAEGYARAGAVDEGLRVLAEALAVVQHTGERVWEAELHRLKGELLQARHPQPAPGDSLAYATEAEACLQQALDVARHQEAKALELRAATSLARLWQQQGRRAEARALLAPVYGWFTEGFDTADLQEARVLLEELA